MEEATGQLVEDVLGVGVSQWHNSLIRKVCWLVHAHFHSQNRSHSHGSLPSTVPELVYACNSQVLCSPIVGTNGGKACSENVSCTLLACRLCELLVHG